MDCVVFVFDGIIVVVVWVLFNFVGVEIEMLFEVVFLF